MTSSSEQVMAPAVVTPAELRRVAVTGAIGSALEYYDFALYGLASALIFGPLFFPALGPAAGVLAAFATYGVGFAARPLGGLYFGSLGDRKGRKYVLVVTVTLMGIATTLIGVLPTAETAGAFGAVALVVLRLAQGFGAGAEQAGASTLMAEVAPQRSRGFYSALPFVGVFLGLAIATGVFSLVQNLVGQAAFLAGGWRITFLISVLLLLVAVYIRLRLRESPVFESLESTREVVAAPVRQLFRESRRTIVVTIGMRLAEQGGSTIYNAIPIAFLTGYVATTVGRDAAALGQVGTGAVFWAALLSVISTPFFGWVSDKIGRVAMYRGGALFLVVWALPSWAMIGTGDTVLIYLAVIGGLTIGANSILGAQCAHFAELFGSNHRYSGVALVREIGAILSGGIAPLLGLYLVGLAGGAWWVMGAYMAVLAAITFVAALFSVDTRGRDMAATADALAA